MTTRENSPVVTCDKCKGAGHYVCQVRNHGTGETRATHVACDMPGCHGGKVNLWENTEILWGHENLRALRSHVRPAQRHQWGQT